MTSPTKPIRTTLYVLARWPAQQSNSGKPDSYLEIEGPFWRWVPEITPHCRFSYSECYRYYVKLTTPGSTMYCRRGQWRIQGFIAPLRPDTTTEEENE